MLNRYQLFRSLLLTGFLCCIYGFSWAQQTISGKVTSLSSEEELPGVNVLVKGTSSGTITDMDGNYTLSVPSGSDSLIFSFVGYLAEEVAINGRSTINVSLAEDITSLQEVVVTALGISKEKEKLGYAISTVDGEALTKARETNVAYSLEGRVAGLNVSGVNGGPGSSAKILLRGMASFGASSPLFVINGVPIDNTQRGSAGEWGGADQGDGISNLNPDDIETMTVLKGASASALYGARAANGVIIITTKSGKKNDFSIEYNMNYTLNKAIDFTDFQYEYGQGQHGVRPATVSDALNSGGYSWGEQMDGAQTIQFDGNMYPYSPATDNVANFYRTAPSFTNTVSVSKGGENGSFRLSLSNMDNQSILMNSGLDRKTANLNINQNVTDKLNVTVVANYINEYSQNRPSLSDAPMNANNVNYLATSIDQSVLSPGYDLTTGAEMTWSDDIYVTNPYFVTNQYVNDTYRKRLITSITARYDFTEWLFLQGRVGYDVSHDKYFQVTPWGTAYSTDLRGALNNLARSETSELNTDVLVGVQRNITPDISADISVGANLRQNYYESIGISGSPFVLPYFYSFNNVESYSRSYDIIERRANSAYYTADFSYKSILTLSTTGRYDAYSSLPSDNRGIFTPSVSASFVFSELTDIAGLSYGKLRGSWGQTSGEPVDAYITSTYYSVGSTVNGITTGDFSTSLPNLFLQPFTLTEFEVGTELKFLEDRVGLDLSYFTRKTSNEIIQGSLSSATGYTSQYVGTGSTENSGVELLLTGTPVVTNKFAWNTSFNFTYLKNNIADIYGPESTNTTLTLGTYRPLNANTALVKGLPGPQVMAYDYVRTDDGQIVVDADGIPVQGELTPMGSVLPKYYGGWNNEFNYKNINLAFLFDFKAGNKVLSASNYYNIYRGKHQMTLEGREDGVVADGVVNVGTTENPEYVTNTTSVEAQTYYQALAQRISALNVLDGSFIKLRQVTLGYSLPSSLLEKTPLESVNLSFVARNLLTLLKYTDNIDPEAGFSPLVKYAGIEGNGLPTTRTYGFNLNVKF